MSAPNGALRGVAARSSAAVGTRSGAASIENAMHDVLMLSRNGPIRRSMLRASFTPSPIWRVAVLRL